MDLKLGADYDINDNNALSFSAQLGNWKFSRDISSAYNYSFTDSAGIAPVPKLDTDFDYSNRVFAAYGSVSGEDYYSENWYRYEGPFFIFTLSYRLNNFKQKQPNECVRMDFDSGLDH